MAESQLEETITKTPNTFRDRLSSAASSAANQVRGVGLKFTGNAPLEGDYMRVGDNIKYWYSNIGSITDKMKLLDAREYINDTALGIITRRLNYLNGSSVTDKTKIPEVEENFKKARELNTIIEEKLKVLAPGLFDKNGNFKEQKKYDNSNSPIGLSYAIASAMNGVPGGGSKRRHKLSTKKLNKRGAKTRTGKSRKSRKSKSKSSKSKKSKSRKNK
jgi:hypothetical protein